MNRPEQTLNDYINSNYALIDIRNIKSCGIYGGVGDIRDASKCIELYDQYNEDIWNVLKLEAKRMLVAGVISLIEISNWYDYIQSDEDFKCVLLWMAVECVCHDIIQD